jgi:hypothetical protein
LIVSKSLNAIAMSFAAMCCVSLMVMTPAAHAASAKKPVAQAASKSEYYMSSPGSIRGGPYATMEQCQASATGLKGSCYEGPKATNPANAFARAPEGAQRPGK